MHVVGASWGPAKTTLVRGACRRSAWTSAITSPTFAIGHRYGAGGGLVVAHLDLYRVPDLAAEDPDLLADYLGEDRITFVEWPPLDDRAGVLRGAAAAITRAHRGLEHDRRRVEVRP